MQVSMRLDQPQEKCFSEDLMTLLEESSSESLAMDGLCFETEAGAGDIERMRVKEET